MNEDSKFVSWVKAHKTELIIAGVTGVGMILVIKNWSLIKGLFKVAEPVVPDITESEPVVEEIVVPIISSDVLDNLTWNKLTARALGDKVWCSAQTINKRIIAAGLAVSFLVANM